MISLILATLSFIGVLVVNFFASMGDLFPLTMQSLNGLFPFPFMPPGRAFMISWRLIYLFQAIILFHFRKRWKQEKKSKKDQKTIWMFFWLSLLNLLWIFLSVYSLFKLSVLVIFAMFFLLYAILTQHKKNQHQNERDLLGRGIYYGWITIAATTLWISQLLYLSSGAIALSPSRSWIAIGLWGLATTVSFLFHKNRYAFLYSLLVLITIIYTFL